MVTPLRMYDSRVDAPSVSRGSTSVCLRDMYLHVAVISPEEVRVLCYPVTEDDTLLESAVRAYVEETAQQIDHYLGLHMQVAEVRLVPGLSTFAAENLK